MRRKGVGRRSGEWTRSASRLTLPQAKPAVKGWSGSPSMRTTRPFSTCARIEHMSGQSWAQTVRIVGMFQVPEFTAPTGAAGRSHDGREGITTACIAYVLLNGE